MTWYGDAQSARTNVRKYNGAQALRRVGGTTNIIKAIYADGPLCRTATTISSTYTSNPQNYSGSVYNPNGYVGRASVMHTVTTVPEAASEGTAFDLTTLLARAAHHGLTLAEYARKIGVTL